MKLDIQTLVERDLSWDDRIPNSNFEIIQEIGKVKIKRAAVPEDAVNLNGTYS